MASTVQELFDRVALRIMRQFWDVYVLPGHFYSPIVNLDVARRHYDDLLTKPAPQSLPGIAIDRQAMAQLWGAFQPFLAEIPFSETPGRYRYGFTNPAFGYGDASVLYAFIRHLQPKRFIEVGSGWSSACTLDTFEHYVTGDYHITFIEPYPALLKEKIGAIPERVTIIESGIQAVPADLFATLEAGDVLFIDSTHVFSTGSDVTYELFEILPRIQTGVYVHFHDMFWPFEYPKHWVLDDNRSWNELYALRAFLMDNPNWEIVFFNNYFASFEQQLISTSYPPFLKNPGGGLWLRRK